MIKQKIIQFFLILSTLTVLVDKAASQCTPGFLGGGRPLILCSPTEQIDYVNLFQVQANYSAQALLPATDTIKRAGLPDTIIFHQVKLQVIATLPSGCKDTAIIRIPFNQDPFPNLGPDKTINICPGKTADISGLYNIGQFQSQWSTPYPYEVTEGTYTLTIRTRDGCTDSANISVTALSKPNLGSDILAPVTAGQKINLNSFFPNPPFPIHWSTLEPNLAPDGTYEGIATNTEGCSDSVLVIVCEKPNLGPNKNVTVCPGEKLNLYNYLTAIGVAVEWNTSTPFNVGVGTYQGIGTNACGLKDTISVSVTFAPKPNLGNDRKETICSGEFLNVSNFFELAGLTAVWSLPDPSSAPVGRHRVIAENSSGCKDTAAVIIFGIDKPAFLNDTTIFVCQNQTRDLTTIYPLNAEEWFIDYGTAANPSAVLAGTYLLTAENADCRYAVTVKVKNFSQQQTGMLPLCIYKKAEFNIFSSNNFRSVVVDKDGLTWAGIDDGGLYQFVPTGAGCGGTWQKSNSFGNATQKDLHVSPMDNDFDIWSASSGYEGARATTGGVFRITSLDNIKRFGSSYDNNQQLGPLSSRFANSLALSPTGKVYVALSTSLDFDNKIKTGAVFEYNLLGNPTSETFVQVPINLPNNDDINVHSAGMRGNEAWFGVGRSCDKGSCSNPYIVMWNTATNSAGGFVDETNSPLPFDKQQLITRSIFTDSQNRTWLGFSSGLGMGLLAPPFEGAEPEWFYLTSQNSGLPDNTSVNFNAITEVNGEIWIGTNKGLVVYDGISDFLDCRSYKLYTTANGLPSNNVTDVAFDTAQLNVWIATDNGIAKMKQPVNIVGNVVNAYCGKYPDLLPEIFREPLAGVQIKLLSPQGNVLASATTDATGTFELESPKSNGTYTVEINYRNRFRYRYANIAGNAVMGEIMIPDSLIKDIEAMKPILAEESTAFKIIGLDLFNFDFDAFNTDSISKSFKSFNSIIETNANDSVLKLANYYLITSAIEKGSFSVGKLDTEIAVSLLDALESLLNATTIGKSMVDKLKGTNSVILEAATKWALKLFESQVEMFLASLRTMQASALARGDQQLASSLKKVESILGATLKAVVKIKEGGLKDGTVVAIRNNIYETIKRGLATLMTKFIFELTYVPNIQPSLNRASTSLYTNVSDKPYSEVFALLIHREDPDTSIATVSNQILEERLEGMANLKSLAKIADVVGKLAETAAKLPALGPQAAAAKALLKGLEVVAKAAQPIIYVGAGVYAYIGADEITDLVKTANPKAAFPAPSPKSKFILIGQSTDPKIFAAKQRVDLYHQSLDQLKQKIAINDSIGAFNLLSQVADYSKASSDLIGENIDDDITTIGKSPNQISNLGEFAVEMVDSGYTRLLSNEFALSILANRYLLDSAKTGFLPDFDSVITNIKQLNNLTLNYMGGLKKAVEKLTVPTFSSIRLLDMVYDEFVGYDSLSQVQIKVRNNGNAPINNLKLSVPSVPFFQFMSYDSTQIISQLPVGKSAGFVFTFRSASIDTTAQFEVIISGSGGVSDTLVGYLSIRNFAVDTNSSSVKAGNWNDPTVWSTGIVPSEVSAVIVRHNLVVNVDATCKTLKAESPAQVQIAAGKKLIILQ